MKADLLTGLYSEHPLVKEAALYLAGNPAGKLLFRGLTGSAGSLVAASLSGHIPSVYLIILPEKEQAAYFYNDLTSLPGESDVLFFPSTFRRSVLYGQTDQANIVLRTGIIDYLSELNRKGIIVSYPEALMEKVVSRKILSDNTFIIKRGDRLSMGFLTELLEEYDFNLVDFVSEPGQYAIRGSIVDVFSFSSGMPFRIDFSGDEVDSLRSFDPDRQLSVEVHEQVRLVPDLSGASRISVSETFISLLPAGSVIWMEDGEIILQKINAIREQALQKKPSDVAVDIDDLVITGSKLLEETMPFRVIETGSMPAIPGPVILEFNTVPQPAFAKNFGLLAEKMRTNYENGYNTLIVSESESQIQRLNEIFAEIGPDLKYGSVIAGLHGGFTDHLLKTAIYTDHQIFDRYHKFSIKGYFTRKESITLKELTGLNPGDYVVHIDHGIGRFGGLEKIEVNGKIQETIRLVYKDNDILYVPIHSLHRISKYKSGENAAPRINKLGSGAWQKLKDSTKRKVKDIAKDLITLYASRLSAPGYSFSQDSYLQRELEASFIYEDTPDQLKTTNEVKKDMESPHPMDRLVCGDVGFGKTEIAIRAAFKAATDSKQTALLVPTTVLAYQHFRTFTERLKNFPCTVEYLTRHKKSSDQKKILEKLEKGQIDIIIGTHKLISDNVRFRDLGLLI
ncbi:MAG: DEAD/DEAH box helicase, partial [Bacteroidales bacterium]|nr:DEAD/DEAH box helicase [Bacteroidales bacterium]